MKAAFTRAYNKEVHLTPYSLQVVKKSRRGGGESELAGEDGENVAQQSEEEEEEGLQKDAMIKVGPPAGDNQSEACIRVLFCQSTLCFHLNSRRRAKPPRSPRRRPRRIQARGRAKEKVQAEAAPRGPALRGPAEAKSEPPPPPSCRPDKLSQLFSTFHATIAVFFLLEHQNIPKLV